MEIEKVMVKKRWENKNNFLYERLLIFIIDLVLLFNTIIS